MEMSICFLTDSWGPIAGGINAFNSELAVALALDGSKQKRFIYSVALDPTKEDVELAKENNVQIIPLNGKKFNGEFDESWIHDINDWIVLNNRPKINVWVGHDIISGSAAIFASKRFGGQSALIHHMSYMRYQGMKHSNSALIDQKINKQINLFNEEAKLYAVGPLLRESAEEMSGKSVIELIPGFPTVPKNRSSDTRLSAIAFGRMDWDDDRIKQGRLVTSAFGYAINVSNKQVSPISSLKSSSLTILGVNKEEQNKFRDIGEKQANRTLSIIPLPFDVDRDSLFKRLTRSNLALMLSLHEGFGLVGWEAIAAEVPLILSSNSGLYYLIEKNLGPVGLGALETLDIEGRRGNRKEGIENFSKNDLKNAGEAILRCASDISTQKKAIKLLRKMLVDKLTCTWQNTAQQFISGLEKNNTKLESDSLEKNKIVLTEHSSHKKYVRLNSHSEYFRRCAKEVNKSSILYKTIVGPTFLEPSWLHERSLKRGIAVELSVVIREKILNNEFAECELILRNNLDRYIQNLSELIIDEKEWKALITEMLTNCTNIFGKIGETGPQIRCIDTGYSHLPTICENVVVVSTRTSPNQKVHGGWLMVDPSTVSMEKEKWRMLFDQVEQTPKESVELLKKFIKKLRNKFPNK